jgi:hypothetical protein
MRAGAKSRFATALRKCHGQSHLLWAAVIPALAKDARTGHPLPGCPRQTQKPGPPAGVCTSKTVGLLVRRHVIAGVFRFIGKEASTRWAGGVDLSMLPDSKTVDAADETCRKYERVVDPEYLDQIRAQAIQFSNKRLSRKSGVARSAIMNFKKGRNTIKPHTLRKLIKTIYALQNTSRNELASAE